MQRAGSLTIVKTIGGVTQSTVKYYITDAFGTYTAITTSELANLSVSDYEARLTAFKSYVESVNIGLSVNTTAAYQENTTACPITN